MQLSTSITSVSWIPSEAITGHVRLPMDIGLGHYDDPPPDRLDDVAALAAAGRFRFANELHVTVAIEDGTFVSATREGRSHICPTDLNVGSRTFQFAPVPFPDIAPEPEVHEDRVVFRRTAGGRTGAPMPRRINRAPFVMLQAPTAWTSLEITIHADGRIEAGLAGASPFPRHWVYGEDGELTGKSATIDFATWSRENFRELTPWEGHDEQTFVTEVESALERELSLQIMRAGRRPVLRPFAAGDLLTVQGEAGEEVFLLLDGVLVVEVDGAPLAEIGPGCRPRRAGRARGGRADGDAARRDRRQGRRGGRRRSRPRPARDGRHRPPSRGDRVTVVVDVLGARGSTPATGPAFVRYGGDTSCVALSTDEDHPPDLLLDAGTGLRGLGRLLPHGAAFRGAILLGHLHWDHTHGLPFCPAVDHPDAEVDLYLPAQGEDPIELLARAHSARRTSRLVPRGCGERGASTRWPRAPTRSAPGR